MTEAEQIVTDWQVGKKCELSRLSDEIHRQVEKIAKANSNCDESEILSGEDFLQELLVGSET